MQTEISVVIPLYNKEHSISGAIDSVLFQSVPPKELIVVDDGSTDSSKQKVVDNFRHHKFIGTTTSLRLLSQTNQGVSKARNSGIAQISTKYVALLDADDRYEKYFLETIASLIVTYQSAKVFVTGYQFQHANGTTIPATWVRKHSKSADGIFENYFSLAAQGDLPICASSVCIDLQALNRIGGFPTGQQMGEDQWVWSLLALRGEIAFSTSIQSSYSIATDNSLMSSPPPITELPFSMMLRDLLDHRLKNDKREASVKAYIRTHLYDLIRRNYLGGNLQASYDLLKDNRLSKWRVRSIYWRMQCYRAHLGHLRDMKKI